MPLVSSAIPNLINGISQQPPALRLASQAESVINCMPSPVEGLKKRPPSAHVKQLTSSTLGSNRPFIHLVDRDGVIQYLVIIQDGDLKVFNLDGTEATVSFPDGKGYLDIANTSEPSSQFRVASVADYTFIANREKTVSMANTTSPKNLGMNNIASMVFVKAANYDTTYEIQINGTDGSSLLSNSDGKIEYKTDPAVGREISGSYAQGSANNPDETVSVLATGHGLSTGDKVRMTFPAGSSANVGLGVAGTYEIVVTDANNFNYESASAQITGGNCTATHSKPLSTIDIATQLKALLVADSNANSAFDFEQDDYIINIKRKDGGSATTDYLLTATDTKTGEDLVAIKSSVDGMDDLPTVSKHGFIIKVQGSKATAFDDYYVKFITDVGSGFGPGQWKESVGPGITFEIDSTTMPHTLVRNANGTFTFGKFTWSARVAGDETTAPNPTFIDRQIQNIDLFRNRLVFLADENVILSAADSYDRFWPETVQTVVDSDPVDLSTGGKSINFLVSSVGFANTLLLFSRHGQFRLDSGLNIGSSLTPKTATITAITTFDMASAVDPVAVGRNIYFPIPKGTSFSGVREFFLPDASGAIPLSEEVTASVPRFIPGNLSTLVASVAEEALALISKDQPKRIYIYKFFFEDDTKLQSAWSYWEVKGSKTILGADIIGSDLYVVVEYSDGAYLEKIALRPENIDPETVNTAGTKLEILLDRKTTEASCSTTLINSGALGVQTVITLPYPIATTGVMAVVGRYDSSNTISHGQVIRPLSESQTGGAGGHGTMTVPGDLSNAKFYVGELYDMNYEFSTPYVKEQKTGGGVSIAAGPKLQMRTWSLIFDKTSAFELKITPTGRDASSYPYNGIILGQAPPLIGSPSLQTGSFRVPVMASNIDTKIEIISSSPLPCRVQSAEWEGFYHTRARRQ